MNEMSVSESRLAVVLGWSRKELRQARKRLGIEKEGGGEIRLYREEVDAVAMELGISASVAAEAFNEARMGVDEGLGKKEAQAATGAADLPPFARVRVVNPRLKNRRVLLGTLEGALPVEVRVRVRDAKAFRSGMILPVRQVSGTFYEFMGRMPKSRRAFMEVGA
jgi:hypothetical protein